MTELTFPRKRTCPFSPPPEYADLRAETPVTRVRLFGRSVWAATRHEDIRAMLTDPRFSSDRNHPNFPFQQRITEDMKPIRISLIGMDPPQHGPARRAVVGEFTVKRLRELRPRIQQIVDEHIDAMLAGPRPVDLVSALSLPIPSLVICELLGVPYADHDFFQARSGRLLNRAVEADERLRSRDELIEYLGKLVTEKIREPGQDLLSRQIHKQRDEGDIDEENLVELAFLLLVAGHETTANMISLSTVALLQHPESLAKIKADPDQTLPAVEELLRYFTIAEFANARVATEDVELGGVLIREGEGVLALSSTANRDPEVFPEPDTLDIERGSRNHIAFGYGPHQCLGQNLARLELQIVIDTLFSRIPDLRIVPELEEIPFKYDGQVFGVYELPVTW
ncbi:cytochrome P450 [Sciscionella sediminilitoris]|uniref:cytochrome P450 n=1 Tax=Sciscionella sediminilitoris TaxID=1445613 RepID=UPI0004DFA56A|nr:cytochrome P450 [Sciscionella sp. SE31]